MIQAKIVADSLTERGHRLTTMEVVMPRYILAEFNTHRMLSKNSASSRAIPFSKMVKEVQERPFIPYAWQKDHKGMQGTNYFTSEDGDNIHKFTEAWEVARNNAIAIAQGLTNCKVTKQLANRLLEPFMYHKVLVSATEWENFFNLRCPIYQGKYQAWKSWKEIIKQAEKDEESEEVLHHLKTMSPVDKLLNNKGQADIHMMALAEAIYDAIKESTPTELKDGEWHIPYSDDMDEDILLDKGSYGFEATNIFIGEEGGWTIEGGEESYYYDLQKLKCKISIARCARLSYQTLGDNPVIDYEKDLKLYDSLYKSKHASPAEHVARVMTEKEYNSYVKGKMPTNNTSINVPTDDMKGWCRNFQGFIQYRELLD